MDAAYGGFFILTDHGQDLLKGIGRSRSVVMDPHKGLFLPYGSGALIVRDEHQLAESHRYSANYLRDAQEMGGVFSSSDLSVELSRPFRGPRLWLPLKLFGIAAFRAALDEKLLLARYFHARLAETPGWIVGPPPDLSVVTYRYAPKSKNANDFNRRLLRAVTADGRAAISATEINGAYTLRLAVLHYRSHLDEVDGLLEVLAREAAPRNHVKRSLPASPCRSGQPPDADLGAWLRVNHGAAGGGYPHLLRRARPFLGSSGDPRGRSVWF